MLSILSYFCLTSVPNILDKIFVAQNFSSNKIFVTKSIFCQFYQKKFCPMKYLILQMYRNINETMPSSISPSKIWNNEESGHRVWTHLMCWDGLKLDGLKCLLYHASFKSFYSHPHGILNDLLHIYEWEWMRIYEQF